MAITSYNLYTHTCIYSQTTKTKFETPRKGKHTMSMIRYRHTQTLRCKYKNGCRIWRCAVMLPVAMITQLSFLSFSTELMIFHWSLHEKTRKQNCFKKKKKLLHPINHDGSIILSGMKRESISTSVITQGDTQKWYQKMHMLLRCSMNPVLTM